MCIVRSRGGEFSWEVSLYVRLTEADESKHCTQRRARCGTQRGFTHTDAQTWRRAGGSLAHVHRAQQGQGI